MIRSAERHEIKTLAELYCASWHLAFSEHFPPDNLARVTVGDFEDRWRGYFADDVVSSFVYEWNSVPLGFVTCKVPKDGPAEIVSMMVTPTCIRAGIGSKLMDAALTHLLEKGCDAAMLWVVNENSRARNFYERFGFALSEEQRVIQRYGIELCQLKYERQLPLKNAQTTNSDRLFSRT